MKYTPTEEFDTEEHDEEMLEWLEGPTTSSDRDLLAAWARARITSLRAERDSAPSFIRYSFTKKPITYAVKKV